MTAVALAALDVTIVSTAMPTIVSELSGVTLYSWLVSIYLLTATTSTPLYGQLADNLGRKPILIFGIILFTAASVLCAQAQTMMQLIVFRGLQGLGAGSIMPMTMTIIGDLFTIEERAKYQAIMTGVWGACSLIGPALGATILHFWTWHGIFWINLPVGALALTLLTRVYHEHNVSRHRKVDVAGALLMMTGVAALLLALQRQSPVGVAQYWPYGIAVACFALLVPVERMVKSPFLPIAMLKRKIIGISYIVALFSGVLQFGASAYMPLFVQGAMGGTPVMVGLTMLPVAFGWPIGSLVSGKLILKWGYKRVLALGMVFGIVGSGLLLLMTEFTPLPNVMGIVFLIGLSMGLTATPLIIAVQHAVEWNQRATATSLSMFSRSIGGVIGVAAMGTIFNSRILALLGDAPTGAGSNIRDMVNNMLDPGKRGNYQIDMLHSIQHELASALHSTYLLPFLASVVAFGVILFVFPGGQVSSHSSESSLKIQVNSEPEFHKN